MTELKLQQKREEFLLDALEYYIGHPERLCTNSEGCYYSPINANNPNSEGCIIGRKISKRLQLTLDKNSFSNVRDNHIFEQLPKKLQNLGQDFLSRCQELHDGKFQLYQMEELQDIIKDYELNRSKFEKYLLLND